MPLIQTLLICGWAALESGYDIKDLMKGETVPFYKTEASWKTDLRGMVVNKTNPDEKNSLTDLNYQDYLRLLLLVQNPEMKMNRIQDLIQLNMQTVDSTFKLCDYNTYLKAEATSSIKYLFITQPFMPNRLKTLDGKRHQFKHLVYQGY